MYYTTMQWLRIMYVSWIIARIFPMLKSGRFTRWMRIPFSWAQKKTDCLKRKKDTLGNYHYTQIQLPEITTNSVNYITPDSRGRLWIGSNGPLTVYDPVKDKLIKNYFYKQHLTWYLKEADGYMWYISMGFKGSS